jgi:peptidoglycan/xylan/chitin deacetylase (PgdA/CDA1 family)
MDVHRLLSPSLAVRWDRLIHGNAPPAGPRPKLLALTFDDGPYPVDTPLLLDVLGDLHVPATFFLIGRDAEQYPELARRIAARGGEIADHTLTHPDLAALDDAAVGREIAAGAAELAKFVSDPALRTLMRPPHGRYREATLRVAQAAGYDVVLWNDDPGDWRNVGAAELARHIRAHASAPEILLLHSGRLATIAMLPGVVADYRAAGYHFVTVGDLLKAVTPDQLNHPRKNPLPESNRGVAVQP